MAGLLTDPLVGRVVDERYEVLSRIARGGMATVYLALDRRLEREVALKVMHPHLAEGGTGSEFLARFRREARAAARLTHPGVVAVFDQGVDGETSYLTMEYVEGTNLRRRMTVDGSLTVREALTITDALLDALAAAHRAGLVHRDVKPENVLLGPDDRVKVADFGLARAMTEVSSTTTGTVLGTVAYLAPELVAHGTSDARTDVYAAGILLYEMLTGNQPFTGATPIQVAYQHVNSDVPAPSDAVEWLPVELDELVMSLAARDPQDRPVDAGAALVLLRRIRSSLDEHTLDRRADLGNAASGRAKGEADEVGGILTEVLHRPERDAPAAPGRRVDPRDAAPTARTMSLAVGAERSLAGTGGAGGDGPSPGADMRAGARPPGPVRGHPGAGRPQAADPALTRWRRRVGAVLVAVAVAAALGLGALWWQEWGPGAWTTVPEGLVGVTLSEASSVLAAEGLEVRQDEVFHPEIPAGSVVETVPAAGDRIRDDGVVELVVSRGPDMRTVPADLVGAPVADVVALLEEAGFTPREPTREHHDTVPVDHVLEVGAEGGASLPRGTEIALIVSDGPAPVTVAGVVGSETAAAQAVLEAQGLKVEVVEEYHETVAAGLVSAQAPAAGAAGLRGDVVTLTVSLGPPLVQVPDLFGRNYDDAARMLAEIGLVAAREDVLGGVFGSVRQQSVPAGESVPKGSTVVLTVV